MKSIQCARAVAALLVVYFHAAIQIENLAGPGLSLFHLFGKAGVDIFFVLSGFIIWRSTERNTHTTFEFYKRRVARIVPLYWSCTLAASFVALTFPDMLKSTKFDLAHVAASLGFVPWPNPASSAPGSDYYSPVIVPGWTLNFEMLFYLVFGLTIFGNRSTRILKIVLCFAAVVCLAAYFQEGTTILSFYDPFLILEFLLGIGVSLLLDADRKPGRGLAWALMFVCFGLVVGLDAYPPYITRFVYSGVPAAFLVYSLAVLDLKGHWPRMILLEKLGDASFSIYLTHIFVLAGLRIVCTWGNVSLVRPEAQILFLVIALGLASLVGWLAHVWFEMPSLAAANRLLGVKRSARPAKTPPLVRSEQARA